MAAYTVEEWKVIVKDYLLEMNAKLNAAKGAQNNDIQIGRIKKDNIRFINRMLPDLLPTLSD